MNQQQVGETTSFPNLKEGKKTRSWLWGVEFRWAVELRQGWRLGWSGA